MLNGSKIGDGHWFLPYLKSHKLLILMKTCFCQSCSFRCALSGHITMGHRRHLLVVNGIEYPISNRSYLKLVGEVSRVHDGGDGSAAIVLVTGEVEKLVEFHVSLADLRYISNWRVKVDHIKLEVEEIERKRLLLSRNRVQDDVDTASEFQGVFAFD